MTGRSLCVVLLTVWAASPALAQAPVLEQHFGSTVVRLAWQAGKEPVAPGLAELKYTLTVEGGPLLEVEPATLGDATESWQAHSTRSTRLEGDRRTHTEVLDLKQAKTGHLLPPSVKVRFRDGPEAEWQAADFVEIAKPRYELAPVPVPPAPERLLPWRIGAGVAGGVVLVLVGLLAWRVLRPKPSPPPAPEEAALRELDRLAEFASAERSEWYHTRLSYVVRRYLADRFAVKAPQQTTAEFLASVRELPQLTGEHHELLRAFLERCDLAKFAPVSGSAEECLQSTAQARGVVQRLAEVAKSGQA